MAPHGVLSALRRVLWAVSALLVGVVVSGASATALLHTVGKPAYPPVPADAAGRPLLMPPAPGPAPAADGPYAFLMTHPDGSAVRWDPCRPIHLVVRGQDQPPDGDSVLREALAAVGAAAGLVLVVDAATDEGPTTTRPVQQPQRYGKRWAPVLVAWSNPQEYPPLAGDTVAIAGPVAVDPPGAAPTRYVSGSMVLDSAWFERALASPLGRRQATAVLEHELGHLVGLDHVSDPMQLMSPVYQSIFGYAAGDRAGLAALGGGPCYRDT